MNKACRICSKPFVMTASQVSRRDYRCGDCFREWKRKYRARRREQGNPVPSFRMPREYLRAYESNYRRQPQIRTKLNARAKIRRDNPVERPKHIARWKLNRAIVSGKITRQPCEVCGSPKSDGHHDDYSKPLDVRWLCPIHHAAFHASVESEGK